MKTLKDKNILQKTISLKYIFIISIFFLSEVVCAQTKARIIGIKDGDTVTALLEGDIQKTLRLAEVDCPESGQPFGKNAKEFTSGEIFGKDIVFYETDQDRYGRTIAKIYYDSGKYLSEEIIKSGLGWWYHQYSKNTQLGKLQEAAKFNGLGLWQDKNAISPYEWRKLNKLKNQKDEY
ncbi:thermonuclease family protein [Sphingobacterium sp. DR205]|uniref:thermonuclease family protein n=1 Tax=Sphingobacterium sp. DR205 TaxID=2713573 RepID=UPI0013E50FE2|nr:thermonuclease family protein [Sphingobacterium sp. DR205]QIH34545.1 nuclease [Sphingobacterium sp. DR205]